MRLLSGLSVKKCKICERELKRIAYCWKMKVLDNRGKDLGQEGFD